MCKNFVTTIYLYNVVSLNNIILNITILCIIILFYYQSNFIIKIIINIIIIKLMFLLTIFIKYKFHLLFTKLLWVGTINIHPVILYISVVILLLNNLNKNYNIINIISNIYCFKNILLGLIIALLLGSLWSIQSLKWGYFWVNDIIEWIILFFIFITIINNHDIFLIKKNNKIYKISLLLIILLIIRLNLINTRHNFLNINVINLLLIIIYIQVLTSGVLFFKKYFSNNILYLPILVYYLIFLQYKLIIFFITFVLIYFILNYYFINFISYLINFKKDLIHSLFIIIIIIWLRKYDNFFIIINNHYSVLQQAQFNLYILNYIELFSWNNLYLIFLEKVNFINYQKMFNFLIKNNYNIDYQINNLMLYAYFIIIIIIFY